MTCITARALLPWLLEQAHGSGLGALSGASAAPPPTLLPSCPPARPSPQRDRMRALFRQGCRLEYLFWDGAWQRQGWPV